MLKPSVTYEDNQCAIFLVKNRQVGIRTKHIDNCHHFLWDMVEENDIDIQYIQSEDNPADIMTKNISEANLARHMKWIPEGELCVLVDTGTEDVKNTRVTDDVITRDKTEYSSHAISEVTDGENSNYRVLITKSRTGK